MKKILPLLISLLLSSIASAAPVNINQASAEEIATALKGIGIKKAQAIVDYRQAHGAFTSTDDLVLVKGIGKKTLSRLRDDLLLDNASRQ